MQTVSQAYSSQVYTQMQNGFPSVVNRKEADSISLSRPQLSHHFTDDSITLSAEGRQRSKGLNTTLPADGDVKQEPAAGNKPEAFGSQTFSRDEMRLVKELQRRDAEVRAHEQAHLTAAGQYASGRASFSYTIGPNGKRYAVGGEVPIDIGKEKTPEETIQKMRTVRRAALAPASPSAADRTIAAQASAAESQAMKELLELAEVSSSNGKTVANGKTDGTPETQGADTSNENSSPDSGNSPQISDYSRRIMTSAYQAISEITS